MLFITKRLAKNKTKSSSAQQDGRVEEQASQPHNLTLYVCVLYVHVLLFVIYLLLRSE